jgi:hypothetical protein
VLEHGSAQAPLRAPYELPARDHYLESPGTNEARRRHLSPAPGRGGDGRELRAHSQFLQSQQKTVGDRLVGLGDGPAKRRLAGASHHRIRELAGVKNGPASRGSPDNAETPPPARFQIQLDRGLLRVAGGYRRGLPRIDPERRGRGTAVHSLEDGLVHGHVGRAVGRPRIEKTPGTHRNSSSIERRTRARRHAEQRSVREQMVRASQGGRKAAVGRPGWILVGVSRSDGASPSTCPST